MITLRPYQDAAISDIRQAYRDGHRRVLLVLPTGAGKTVCFTYIAQRMAAKGKRIWIIAHRDELLNQISKALLNFNVPHDIMRGGSKRGWQPVQVCSIQTLVRRLHIMEAPDQIIFDEAHHIAARSYTKVPEAHPTARILGVTATPVRNDGKGLGNYFDVMVEGPTTKWLTDNGFLAPADVYAPELADMSGVRTRMGDYDKKETAARMDKPAVYGSAVSYYKQIAYGKRIIVFCVNLTHVQRTLQAYRDAGIPAGYLDGNMSNDERAQVTKDFEAYKIWVLITCEIVSEGYDVPGCDGVQMLRPTQSLGLFLQQVGRGLRIAPGKERAIIIDHVANCGRTVNGVWVPKHGFPTDERVWDLDKGIIRDKQAERAPTIRQCMECYALMGAGIKVCPKCGYTMPVVDRTPDTVEGSLKRVDRIEPISTEDAIALMNAAVTIQDWHNVAKRLGKSSGWAFIQYRDSRYDQIHRISQQQKAAPEAKRA